MAAIRPTRGILNPDLEEERWSTPMEASLEQHIWSWIRRRPKRPSGEALQGGGEPNEEGLSATVPEDHRWMSSEKRMRRTWSTPDAMNFGSRWVSRDSEKLGIKRAEENSLGEPVEEYGEGNQENVVNTRWDELWLQMGLKN